MTVKKLKEILSLIPEDHEVMVKSHVADFASPIEKHFTGTIQALDTQVGIFCGLPVMGGEEKKVIILSADIN